MNDSIPLFQAGKEIEYKTFELILNNKVINSSKAHLDLDIDGYHLIIFDPQTYREISDYSVESLFSIVKVIHCIFLFDLDIALNTFSIHGFYVSKISDYFFHISFLLGIDVANWANIWSPKEQFENFLSHINSNELEFKTGTKDFSIDYFETNNIDYLSYTLFVEYELHHGTTLDFILNKFTAIFSDANKAIKEKQSYLNTESLIERFHFPLEVKTACEQYLLYFAEFLKDVGIEVKSSIAEEDENIILAVEPKNKEEALGNISQLLKLYLQLPNSPVVTSYQSASYLSFPAQKLQAQVLHLQSQLTLANAERQYLNATIQQKDTLISQQAQTIQSQQFTTQVLVDSLQKKKEDEEELVGKIIRVKDYEAGPLAIGLPELLRKLKEIFGSQ